MGSFARISRLLPPGGPGRMRARMAVSEELRASFTAWCRDELFSPDIREATRLINRYCDLQLAWMYRELGLAELLAEPKKATELTGPLGFVDSASITLRDALRRLGERTGVVKVEGAPLDATYQHVKDPEDPTAELKEVHAKMAALGEDFTAATDFIDFGRDSFVKSLKDDPDYMDKLLSGRMKDFAELWHRATNADPLQDLHGAMGARVIEGLIDGGTILEIGGGTGNGARHLFRHLKSQDALAKVGQYIFTDISMRFVLASKHEFEKAYPEVNWGWKFFDLNKTFGEQKFGPESVDMIYAVNAAHVAKDIVGFLEGCREALRPGGHVVFAERIRMNQHEMAPREFTLNLSVYHRSAPEQADYRPMQCYLHPDNWHEVVKRAGFSACDVMPDLDGLAGDFPDQYASVVVATK
jgi:SAM-dependent methyltransferase